MIQRIKSFLFENKNTRQTIAKNTFWMFSGEITSRLLRMAIVIYAARVLGADGWGVFSYAITLVAFFTIFSDIGLTAILTREAAKNPELRSQYLSTSLFLKFVLVALSVILVIFAAPYFTKIEEAKNLLVIVAFILVFDGFREFGFGLNRAIEKMEKEAIAKTLTNVLIVIFGFIFLMLEKSPKSLALSYLIGSGLGFFYTAWTLREYFKNLISNFSKKLLWPIFSAAWPFALLSILTGIMMNTDTIMLGWWKSASDIGYYSVSQRIMQVVFMIPMLMATSIFPVFARFAEKENEKFRLLLEKSISISLIAGIPIILGGLILSQNLITSFFGFEYIHAITTFQILLLSVILMFPSIFIGNAVFAYNKQKSFVGFLALGAIGNVALNFLLIPKYGIEGSAVATLGAQIISTGFIWLKMKKINNFKIFSYLPRIFIASVLMSGFAYLLNFFEVNAFINIFLSIILYFWLLYLAKEPLLKEIKFIIQPK